MKNIKLLLVMLLAVSVFMFAFTSCDLINGLNVGDGTNNGQNDDLNNDSENEDEKNDDESGKNDSSTDSDDENINSDDEKNDSENDGANDNTDSGNENIGSGDGNGSGDENTDTDNKDPDKEDEEKISAVFYSLYDNEASSLIADMIWVLPGEEFTLVALFENNLPDSVVYTIEDVSVNAAAVSPVIVNGDKYYAVSAVIPAISAECEYELTVSYSSNNVVNVNSYRYIVDDAVDNPIGEVGEFKGVTSNYDTTLDYSNVDASLGLESIVLYTAFSAPVSNLSIYITDLNIVYLTPTSEYSEGDNYIYSFIIESVYIAEGCSYNVMLSHGSSGFDQTNHSFTLNIIGGSTPENPDPENPLPGEGDVEFYGAMTEEMIGPFDRVYIPLGYEKELILCFSGKASLEAAELDGSLLSVISEGERYSGYAVIVSLPAKEEYAELNLNISYSASGDVIKDSVTLIFGENKTESDKPIFLDRIYDENMNPVDAISVAEGGSAFAYLAFSSEIDINTIQISEAPGTVIVIEGYYEGNMYLVKIEISGFYTADNAFTVQWGEYGSENMFAVGVRVILPEVPEILGAWTEDYKEESIEKIAFNAQYGGETYIYLRFNTQMAVHSLTIGEFSYSDYYYEWYQDGDSYILKITQSFTGYYLPVGNYSLNLECAFGEYSQYPYHVMLDVEVKNDAEASLLGVITEGTDLSDTARLEHETPTVISLVFNAPVFIMDITVGDSIFPLNDSARFEDGSKWKYEWQVSTELLGYTGTRTARVNFTYHTVEYSGEFKIDIPTIELIKRVDEFGNELLEGEQGYHAELSHDVPFVFDLVYSVAPAEVRMDRRGNGDIENDYLSADLLGYNASLGGYVARFTLYADDFVYGEVLKFSLVMKDNYESTNPGNWDKTDVIILKTAEPKAPISLGLNGDGITIGNHSVTVTNGMQMPVFVMLDNRCEAQDLFLDLWVDGSYYKSITCTEIIENDETYAAKFDYYAEFPGFGDTNNMESFTYKVTVRHNIYSDLMTESGVPAVYLIEVTA